MGILLEHVEGSCLERVHISKNNRLMFGGTSKGNQVKWLIDSMYVKLNTWEWYEDISEVFVSFLLRFTSIKDYVEYFPCIIIEDGEVLGKGCYSYSFLDEGESSIPLYKVLKNAGVSMKTASYDCVIDTVYDFTGMDIKGYLDNCLCLDAICCNEDRHLNNLSIIKSGSNYKPAPVFDNGLACMSDIFSYPLDKSVEENMRFVQSLTFYSSFERQLLFCRVTP